MTTATETIVHPSAQSLNGTKVITLATLDFNPYSIGVMLAHRWLTAQLNASDDPDLQALATTELAAAYKGPEISAYVRGVLELAPNPDEWRVAVPAVRDGWNTMTMELADMLRLMAEGNLKDKDEQIIEAAAPDMLLEMAFHNAAQAAVLEWVKLHPQRYSTVADGPGTSLVTAPPRVNERKAEAKWVRAQCELDDTAEPDWVTKELGPKGLNLDDLQLDPRNAAVFRQLSQVLGALSRANRNG